MIEDCCALLYETMKSEINVEIKISPNLWNGNFKTREKKGTRKTVLRSSKCFSWPVKSNERQWSNDSARTRVRAKHEARRGSTRSKSPG